MENRIIKYLKQPYPNNIGKLKSIVISSLLVFFLLAVFQPFGLSNIKEHKLFILLGYMIVTFLSLSALSFVFPLLWKDYYKESNWTVGKELLSFFLIVFTIALGNSFYSFLFFSTKMDLVTIGFFLMVTLLISIFPITLFTILRQNRLLSKNLREVTEMNNKLVVPHTSTSSKGEMVTIEGNGRETLDVEVDSFLFAESNGNYINVFFSTEGKAKKKVMRCTMKQMEEAFAPYPSVIKCHRAFMVNTDTIEKVKGNSQGYRLLLAGVEDEIPVSRAYSKQLKDIIDYNPEQ
ncbi:LytTR family transcriptional regulator DNA-binding domain-containing protein [uncultured Bacteroides sp.]|uniref:LytTR family transcriptional regulator DNA-binding domain-containing protein n=1 Tax=uncultured Bacteroides sp. TaxID=162156 RepID=UPI002AAA6F7E|nr:LytTR family transcriptional regulator DNA-binding domain-containing protein [uncultured Bacteroides sp.]